MTTFLFTRYYIGDMDAYGIQSYDKPNLTYSLAEKANQERVELENMADQLRGLANPSGRVDSVNLDNLFDFLADVPAQRGAPDGQPAHQPSIAEIGDSMQRLAEDMNHEVCIM